MRYRVGEPETVPPELAESMYRDFGLRGEGRHNEL